MFQQTVFWYLQNSIWIDIFGKDSEVFIDWFQRAKAMETRFHGVQSISFISAAVNSPRSARVYYCWIHTRCQWKPCTVSSRGIDVACSCMSTAFEPVQNQTHVQVSYHSFFGHSSDIPLWFFYKSGLIWHKSKKHARAFRIQIRDSNQSPADEKTIDLPVEPRLFHLHSDDRW